MTSPGTAGAAQESAAAGSGRSRPHILAFDLIRILIVALVVGVHTLTITAGDISESMGAFVTAFHTSRELFFLLTAFVLSYNYGNRRQLRRMAFWRRRFRLVVPVYVAWTFIYFLADGERLDPVSSALASFGGDLISGDARYQLYFLLVTMQVYLAFPLLRWLLQRTARHHLALLVAAGAYELALTFAIQHHAATTGLIGEWFRNPDPLLPTYLFYVIAGGIAGWHFDRFAAFTRRHLTAARVMFLAGLGAGVGTYLAEVYLGGQSPAAASAVFQPVVVVESAAFGWALFAAGLTWADAGARHRRLVSAGAGSSFGIYLVHPLVLQGALALAGATGVLAAIRGAPTAAQLAAFLGVGVPLIYGVSWALAFLAGHTPLSLVLTGRQRTARPDRTTRLNPVAVLIAAAILILVAAACTNGASAAAKTTSAPRETTSSHEIKVDGLARTWEQLSPGGAGGGQTPIIVVLSGRNATPSEEISRDGLVPLVKAGQAELVYPAGVGMSWNAGGCCGEAAQHNVSDVAFLQALVAQVDPGHSRPIYLAGYSNGGRMVYRMACTDPQLFDALAVVKAMPEPGCSVTQPVSFLQIDSTNDPYVPYQPGDPGMESPAATTEVRRLRSADGITQQAGAVSRGSLQLQTWGNGQQGTRLAFATYHGGQHSWPAGDATTPSAADVIWSFFSGTTLR